MKCNLLLVLMIFTSSLFAGDPRARLELRRQYEAHARHGSDINEHIPVLRRLATECSSVIEIGIREVVSTWGILQGLSENTSPNRLYIGIDIRRPPEGNLQAAQKCAEASGISFQFWQANDMEIDLVPAEFLFIDSLHTYCHLTYELEKFSSKISKYIAMHDTSDHWSTHDDDQYQGDYSEYPPFIDRTKRGLWLAVVDFLANHPEWKLHERRMNNNGFTILKRVAG